MAKFHRYYLAKFEWDDDPVDPGWRVPGAVGFIDLRTLPQMSKSGGTPEGNAFASFDREVSVRG